MSEATNRGIGAPDLATIYRWRKGQLPQNAKSYLQLCGLLDIDPFAMIEIVPGQEEKAIRRLNVAFWAAAWPHPALKFISEFFGQQFEWPPIQVAEYYKRRWETFEIFHNPSVKANYYANIALRTKNRQLLYKPCVFHFAYRQAIQTRVMPWVQYGIVEISEFRTKLIDINGRTQNSYNIDRQQNIYIGTWFGPGAAEFRIASIHAFDAWLDPDCDASLRFIA
ncbi:hypothetical protein [Hyphobacterium sp.]|uniref:hypothetical protein n=1 Tax=Hyphobacterium sp. TaxID=2004662 RepID=UPI003BA913DC